MSSGRRKSGPLPPGLLLSRSDAVDAAAERASHAWTTLAAGSLRGLTHAFGNRLHALEFLRTAIGPDDPFPDELPQLLGHEIDLCGTLMTRYRLMVLSDGEEALPVQIAEALGDAVALWELHAETPDAAAAVDVAADTPALLVPPVALTQALLLLLVALTARPDVEEVERGPRITVAGTRDAATIRLAYHGTARADALDLAMDASRWLLRRLRPAAGLVRSDGPDGTAVSLSLPSLAAARAAERAAG